MHSESVLLYTNQFSFDCAITIKFIPGTYRYWAMSLIFLAKGNSSSLWLEMNSCLTGIYWLKIWHAALTTCTSIFWVQSHCMVLACKIKYFFKQHFMHISSSEVYIFVLLECWNYVLNILSQCLKVKIG